MNYEQEKKKKKEKTNKKDVVLCVRELKSRRKKEEKKTHDCKVAHSKYIPVEMFSLPYLHNVSDILSL